MLQNISGPLGSIPGGWYKDTDTSVEYYVKFYKNEITAKLEYFANLVYCKLGVYVPEKRLDILDGHLVVVSKKVGKGERATKEEQRGHADLVNGFVADAFLNNWDVTGEHFDNIVKDENGHLYRVDNGGVGPIRANEGRKNFVFNAIPEIDDMRNPRFQAGYVFENVSDVEIGRQAVQLVKKVSEQYLVDTVSALQLEENDQKELIDGFLSRRFYLAEKYATIAQ
jgi:hypothetical protein